MCYLVVSYDLFLTKIFQPKAMVLVENNIGLLNLLSLLST